MGWSLPLKYYLNSLKILKIKKNEKIYTTGDDESFVKLLNFYLKKNGYVKAKAYLPKKNKALNDFKIMAQSEKLIMSNSTFCWWAAALRTKLNLSSKNVMFPKNWFPANNPFHNKLTNPGNPFNWKCFNN